jgi:ferritin-like metal-binding protein YciE
MEKMSDLRDLLKHEIYDLQSAEEQIIKALPAMIEKANNGQLKTSLQRHLEITQKQLLRLDQVQGFLKDRSETQVNEKKGLLARLFKRNHLCKGMQGLIEEGEKIMAEEMSPEVLDAAIIASAQKIEHYEICGYGTARAFAKELNLMGVTQLLEETLNEEYEADDTLTELAVGRLNQKAESASANSDAGNIDRSPAKETPREISKRTGIRNGRRSSQARYE